MPHLPATWTAHLDDGIAYRIGSCTLAGEPRLMRAVGARALPDGQLEALVAREPGRAVLAAVAESGQVALVAGRPSTHRTLHVKGRHAALQPAGPEHQAWLDAQREGLVASLKGFGVRRDELEPLLLSLTWQDLVVVRFVISGAWDQTPGPGAGGGIELVPGGSESVPASAAPREAAPTAAGHAPDPASPSLREVRRLLEGVIPPSMCTVSAEGVPHLNYLSHVEYVDEHHVALTYQFFNRSRANVLATGRAALAVECPFTGACTTLQLQYQRTETQGPVFERLRAKLAGIAAHTGMDRIFRLQGADLYRVSSLQRVDDIALPPGQLPRCDVAAAARSLAQRLGEVGDLSQLVPVFMQGLQELVGVEHAILWLLDGRRQSLYTVASLGYETSGVGSELPLADAGLAGVAVREEVPIRIGHMTTAYTYGRAWRGRAEDLGLQAAIAPEIPLPGLSAPRSQLAVPLRARGRTVGALLCESDRDQFFSYDDEDGLILVGAQLAQALAALQAAEIDTGAPARPQAEVPAAGGPAPLLLRHWPRDHSVFAGDDYLIKGVAGAILWRLACELVQRGRTEFTTRELRLAGGDLGLPDVQDNLGVRLLLLERRLAERQCGLAIERTGRGRFRLVTLQPLLLQEQATD